MEENMDQELDLSFAVSMDDTDDHYELNKGSEVALAKMLCIDLLPISFVDQPGWRAFIDAVNPEVTIASSEVYAEQVIPELYKDVLDEIKAELNMSESISISIDGWPAEGSKIKYPVIIVAHFICNNTFKPKHYILDVVFKQDIDNASSFDKIVSNCLAKFSIPIENVQMIVSNGGNPVNLLNNATFFQNFEVMLQTALNDGIKLIMSEVLLFNLRKIRTELKKASETWQTIKRCLKTIGVAKSSLNKNSDGWVFLYLLMECLLKKKDVVTVFLSNHKSLPQLTVTDWQHISLCKDLLEPIFDCMKLIKSHGANIPISMIMPFYRVMQSDAWIDEETDMEELKIAKRAVSEGLERILMEKLADKTVEKRLILSTLTDSRFKDKFFKDSKKDILVAECTEILTEEEYAKDNAPVRERDMNNPFVRFFASIEAERGPPPPAEERAAKKAEWEVGAYLRAAPQPFASPYEFWSKTNNGVFFPTIKKLAQSYLGIPATPETIKKKLRLARSEFRKKYPQFEMQKIIAFLHLNLPLLKELDD